jgi:OOP family OmpA-OmpF porin
MSAPAVGVDFVDGVPVTAISVVGMGEKGLLVPTPDGVREPQNRRVEIVIQ